LKKEREYSQICAAAKNYCQLHSCDPNEVYLSTNILHNLDCGLKIEDDVKQKLDNLAGTTMDLRDFNSYVQTLRNVAFDVSKFCKRLREWVPSYGIPRYNPKVETSDLLPARIIYDLAVICKDQALQTQALNTIGRRVAKVDNQRSIVLDKKTPFLFTTFLLSEGLSFKSENKATAFLKDGDYSGLINSLIEYGSKSNFIETKESVRAAELLNKMGFVFPQLADHKIKESAEGLVLKFSTVDVYGRPAKASKPFVVKANGNTYETSSNFVVIKSDNNRKPIQVDFTQIINGVSHTTSTTIFATQDLHIQQLQLAVGRGTEKPKDFTNREGDTLTCTQENRIYVQFKTDKFYEPEYAAVYLRLEGNADYEKVSAANGLTYNKEEAKFTGVIDLGNTDEIFPVSGRYSIVVSLADRGLTDNINKVVGHANVKFNNEVQVLNILDSSMARQPEIIPTILPPPAYSMMINLVVSGALVFIALILLKVQMSQGWNSKLFPRDPTKVLYNYAFWVTFSLQ